MNDAFPGQTQVFSTATFLQSETRNITVQCYRHPQKMGQPIILSGAGTTNPQNYFRTVMEYLTVESKLPVGDVVCFAALVSDFDFMCCRQEQCTVLWVLALATKSLLARGRMLYSRTTNLWIQTRNQ